MIGASAGVAIYFVVGPVDLRCSFDRLAAVVREQLGRDPLGGALFIFAGRRSRDRVKILFWDRTGYCILYKRFERHAFVVPEIAAGASHIELTAAQLRALLTGVEVRGSSRRGVAQRAE